jgi:excisionase family DNA binding protein
MDEPTKSETCEYAIGVRQVAKRYSVTTTTICKWIADNHLPYLPLPGGDYRLRRAVWRSSNDDAKEISRTT